MFPLFGLGPEAARLVVIVLAIGFIPMLVLSWVFELTPQGLVRDDQVDRDRSITPQNANSLDRLIMVLLALALVYFAIDKFVLDPRRDAALSESAARAGAEKAREEARSGRLKGKSVAVLPFEFDTDRPGSFADGIHDDLLRRLSGIRGLSVIARSSVDRYRESDKSSLEIAGELGVRWILAGTVHHFGDQVRVSVRLVDPDIGVQAWADAYVYDLSAANMFAVQSEITHKIAGALETRLTPDEKRSVGASPTANLRAYEALVEARILLEQREELQMRRALSLFEHATELDPDFTLAWVGVATALYELVDYGFSMPDDSIARSRDAADRALQLDPGNAEAHVSRGMIHHLEQEGLDALRLLERAIELRPSYAEAFSKVSWAAQILGRPKLATESAEKALDLDPLALEPRVNFSFTRLLQKDYESALEILQPNTDLIPDWPTNRFYEGVVLYHMGNYADAARVLEELSIPWAGYGPLATRALAHAASGDAATASMFLAEMKDSDAHPFLIGLVLAGLGDSDGAFAQFESIDNWSTDADWPILAARYLFPDVLGPLRLDPRYDRMLRNMDRAWGLVM